MRRVRGGFALHNFVQLGIVERSHAPLVFDTDSSPDRSFGKAASGHIDRETGQRIVARMIGNWGPRGDGLRSRGSASGRLHEMLKPDWSTLWQVGIKTVHQIPHI